MKVILKTRGGYLNVDNGVKMCKKEDATEVPLSELRKTLDSIYEKKPMIGKIFTERVF